MSMLHIVEDESYEPFGPYLYAKDLPEKLYALEVTLAGPVPDATLSAFEDQHPGESFYYPSTRRVYRSVSAARARADLLRDCGCEVTVYECTPDWAVCETKQERIARLEAENAELRASLGLDGAA